MDKEIIIHIGIPKTASTYIQYEIFPKLEDIYLTGKIPQKKEDPFFDLYKKLYALHHIYIDFNPDKHLIVNTENEKNLIFNYINSINQQKILFTNEDFGVGFKEDGTRYFDILKEVFPKAKVFIVIRRQDEWLESLYKLSLGMGFSYKIDEFINYSKNEFCDYKEGPANVNVKNYNWLNMVSRYIDFYGKENVLVLPYEMLDKDINQFLEYFYNFTEITPYYPKEKKYVGRGYSFISSTVALFVNRFLSTNQLGKFRHFLKEKFDRKLYIKNKFINGKKRKIILDFYKESNKKLEKLIGIDLKQYGYY